MSTKPDSSQIKHETGTLKDIADASKPLADYTALRAYTGTATTVRITSTGIAGFFTRDSDVVTADNGGTVIVDASGRRWKRVFDGAVNVKWFGAVGDGVVDDTVPVKLALKAIQGTGVTYDTLAAGSLYFTRGDYIVAPGTLTPDTGSFSRLKIFGDGLGNTRLIMRVPTALPDGEYFLIDVNGGFDLVEFCGISTEPEWPRLGQKASLARFANDPLEPDWRGRYMAGLMFNQFSATKYDRLLVINGTDMGSELSFNQCRITAIQDAVFDVNNHQSLNIVLTATHIELYLKDCFRYASGASVHVFGGSFINPSDTGMSSVANPNRAVPSSADCTLLNINLVGGDAGRPSNCLFTFDGIRTELRSSGQLLKVGRVTPEGTAAIAKVNFSNSTVSDLLEGGSNIGQPTAGLLRSGSYVSFDNCVVPSRSFTLRRDDNRNQFDARNAAPKLSMNSCAGQVHPNEFIVYENSGAGIKRLPYGTLHSRNFAVFRASGTNITGQQEPYDCDTWAWQGYLGGAAIQLKRAVFCGSVVITANDAGGRSITGHQVNDASVVKNTDYVLRVPVGSFVKSARFVTLSSGTPQVHTYTARIGAETFTIYNGALDVAVNSEVAINRVITSSDSSVTIRRTDAATSPALIIGWIEVEYL